MQTQEINIDIATKVLTSLLGVERTQFIYAMYDLLEQTAREARQEAEMRAVDLYEQGVRNGQRVTTASEGVFDEGYEEGYKDGHSDGYDMAMQAVYSEKQPDVIDWPIDTHSDDEDLRIAVEALHAAYEGDSGDETDAR